MAQLPLGACVEIEMVAEIASVLHARRSEPDAWHPPVLLTSALRDEGFAELDAATQDAALRAMEINAEVVIKATKVDGVYTADPMIHADATKYPTITYLQVLERQLKVMDTTAISLCMDNKLPIVVFNLRQPGNLKRAVMGEPIGTTVS